MEEEIESVQPTFISSQREDLRHYIEAFSNFLSRESTQENIQLYLNEGRQKIKFFSRTNPVVMAAAFVFRSSANPNDLERFNRTLQSLAEQVAVSLREGGKSDVDLLRLDIFRYYRALI